MINTKEISLETLVRYAKRVLETPFWFPTLETDTDYARLHDDHDGTCEGSLHVHIDRMGDVFVHIQSRTRESGGFSPEFRMTDHLRFRIHGGGGMSQRTRSALMILAEAIRLDNEEVPTGDPAKNRPEKVY